MGTAPMRADVPRTLRLFRNWPALRPESNLFLHFDAIRILGAVFVVAVHWRSEMHVTPNWAPIADRLENLSLLVDMFFVLSGFVICHIYAGRMGTSGAFLDFLKKRIARIGPLHWATFACFAAIGIGAPLAGYALQFPENYDPKCLAPNLLFTHALGQCDSLTFNYPSWSISAEMACYALLPLFLLLYRAAVWLPGAIGVAMMGGLTFAGGIGPDEHPWYFLSYDWGALRALPAFGLGVTLYGLRDRLALIPHAALGMYATFATIIAAVLAGVAPILLMPLVYLLAICGAAADAKGKAGPVTRALAPYGTISLSIYLLHLPFAVAVFTIGFDKVLHLEPLAKNIAIVASAPLLIFVAYVSFVGFETPARRWISGLGRKKRTPAEAPANANAPPASDPAQAPPQQVA